MSLRFRIAAPLLTAGVAMTLAACGGGGDKPAASAPRGYGAERGYLAPLSGGKAFAVQRGLVPPQFSAAGQRVTAGYEPQGEIVADSGFRPQVDGFAFENYGNDLGPTNLTAASMQDLFGSDVVCLGDSSGADCVLTPAAQAWMENADAAMGGGHCEGFSMLALAMYADRADPADFGASSPIDLRIRGNPALQSEIAERFMYQALPSVLNRQVRGAPSDIVDALVQALPTGREMYTLGIYKRDRTGGHAITPIAVEDRGDGQYAILVYDNNFPGATRAIEVDTNSDTWRYVGGTNPKDPAQVYEGDARSGTLELDPLTPGEGPQPCLFCNAEQAKGAGKGALLPQGQRYTEITLQGDPADHPHLVFEDDQGRRTGIVGGQMLTEIPDIEVVRRAAVENWKTAPEPQYRLPEGRDYVITIDGTDLERTAKPTVNLVGAGLVIEVEDITIAPGQKDRMQLPGGYGITYESNGRGNEAPNIFAGVVRGDSAYVFAASAVGVQRGSAVSLLVVQDEKVVILDSTGARGQGGRKPYFILNLTKLTPDGRTGAWTRSVRLAGERGEKIGFEYDETAKAGQPLPLIFVGADGDPTGKVVLAKPDEA